MTVRKTTEGIYNLLEIIQSFEKAIEVFRDGEKKHDYELLEFPRFKQIYIDVFSEMHTEVLKELVQLPDPYFKEHIEDELKARRIKARLLKTHERFHRGEGQVCLV